VGAVQGLLDFLRTLGAARLAAMVAVALTLVAFFAFVILRVTAPQMTLLFNDLPPGDSGAIVKELERQAIAFELQAGGTSILVPRDQVARLRVRLAESGLPKGGGVGYEIFDKSDVLGATSFVQNINRLRALEGELARTIQAIDRVQSARVHLVLPERPLFSRDKFEPSASIVLKVRGVLEAQQVRAIRHLIATAVNGLKPERISIVDEAGRLLADGSTGDGVGDLGAGGMEHQQAFERRLREQVESIIASVVGPGRARVQLTADFDVNRITETSDKFDPEGRVVRSSQTREEQSASAGGREGQVSAGNELPGAARGGDAANRDQSKKTEEIVNYEISRTTKTQVIEGARIKRISAAVVVDGVYSKNDKGESVYQPRSKEEMDRIGALVRTAIGFDEKRGDKLEVVNLRFAEAPTAAIAEAPSGWMSLFAFTKADIMRGAELGVLTLLALLVLLFVVRPLVRRILTPDERPAMLRAEAPALAAPAAASPGGGGRGAVAEPALPVASETAKMIDIAQVKGQVHAQSVQKVGELADRNPQETVAIIRHWLHETA
jgi:flagellar M-ring protein FliF